MTLVLLQANPQSIPGVIYIVTNVHCSLITNNVTYLCVDLFIIQGFLLPRRAPTDDRRPTGILDFCCKDGTFESLVPTLLGSFEMQKIFLSKGFTLTVFSMCHTLKYSVIGILIILLYK